MGAEWPKAKVVPPQEEVPAPAVAAAPVAPAEQQDVGLAAAEEADLTATQERLGIVPKSAEKVSEIPILETEPGNSIDEFATNVLIPEARKGMVRARFNSTVFDVPQGEYSHDDINEMRRKKSEEDHREYLHSAKGITAMEKLKKEVALKQEKVDRLTDNLSTVAFFSNPQDVLQWCMKLEKVDIPPDWLAIGNGYFAGINTSIDKELVLAKFAEHGYIPASPRSRDNQTPYNKEDKDSVEKYAIGIVLDAINNDEKVPEIRELYNQWKSVRKSRPTKQ